jgi:hypothetical protein
MLGDNNVVVGEIKTPVIFVVSRVSKENISVGLRCQFVSGFGREIRIAGTTELAQVIIGGSDSMELEVWTSRADRLGGEVVQQICGGVEPFYPVVSWNRSLKSREYNILLMVRRIRSVLPLYGESVGKRHLHKYSFGGKECTRGGVIKLTTIVTLDNFDGAAKLCQDISEFF